jgi:glycosyltransferase involved in cell wall biosynthesis
MTTAMQTAALIPAFNEATTIGEVVRNLTGVVHRVLVVDDGSTDSTAERAKAAGADVVVHAENRGKGVAVRTGISMLTQQGFSHALIMDGDMQHLPEEAPALIRAAAETGADLVLGERQFQRHAMPTSRYHANRWGSRVLSWFVGAPIRDTQCGFRVVRLAALKGVQLRSRSYEIETEMLVKLWRRHARINSVPVSAVYGAETSKLRPIRDTTRTCFLAVYYRYIERL